MKLHAFYENWISPQRWMDRLGMGIPMRMVIGLLMLVSCVLLFASALRLIPGGEQAELRRRTTIAEMAAMQATVGVSQRNEPLVKRLLEEMVGRYADIRSASLRHKGRIVAQTPGHEKFWAGAVPEVSTATHMRVVLSDKDKPWGELEIAFAPMTQAGAWWTRPGPRLAAFILACSCLLFWFFLSRTLTMLDPSAVIPDRMQLLMDTLVEGMVILDEQGRIVMVNQSFANTAFSSVERLMGQKLSGLPWLAPGGDEEAEFHPWNGEGSHDLQQRDVPMRLRIGTRNARRLNVNASPIPGPQNTRLGTVVTFADQTVLEADHLQMAEFVSQVSDAGEKVQRLHEEVRSHADVTELKQLDEMTSAVRELAELCHSAARDTDIPPAEKVSAVADEQGVTGAPITTNSNVKLNGCRFIQ